MAFLCIEEQGVKEEAVLHSARQREGKRETELGRAGEGSCSQALAGAIRRKSNWHANHGVSESRLGRSRVTLVATGCVEEQGVDRSLGESLESRHTCVFSLCGSIWPCLVHLLLLMLYSCLPSSALTG